MYVCVCMCVFLIHYHISHNIFFFKTGTNLEGTILEVTLAKPVDKSEYVRYTRSGLKVLLSQVGCHSDSSMWNTPGKNILPESLWIVLHKYNCMDKKHGFMPKGFFILISTCLVLITHGWLPNCSVFKLTKITQNFTLISTLRASVHP